ncbi:MAG: DUF3618 domain-containing protein [Actinobacteria bacterium]|nr:DUF3618 domain-containing protein [Actinomycetota bacterium]MCB8996488.1 DUF3618 domain-containing protein [Actinomycetota bacterium]MCB9424923.1 DUF3618 domain-containing protein [Actinomycetota bacterium]HRY10646.1 DUF3618 domain-containing protein [Candidatus Nanopelagicales bacterium]
MSDASDAVVPAVAAEVEKKAPEVVKGEPQPVQRSVADIESDMDATRARLAGTLNDLKVATQPKNILNRQTQKVKDFYVDEYGAVRIDHVAITVGVVVGVIVLRKTWRRITR